LTERARAFENADRISVLHGDVIATELKVPNVQSAAELPDIVVGER
jgi:hypothetical protein